MSRIPPGHHRLPVGWVAAYQLHISVSFHLCPLSVSFPTGMCRSRPNNPKAHKPFEMVSLSKVGVAFACLQVLEMGSIPPQGCGMGLLWGQGSRDLLCSGL